MTDDTSDHDRAFFEQMATCRAAYRRLGDCIHDTLGAQTTLDLGAGLGYVTARLTELGWRCVASDLFAPDDLREGDAWLRVDLRFPQDDPARYSCVICTETAEHVEASHADSIVSGVVHYAQDRIVWSAAQPGQEWPGHINLQPPSYWLERFQARGWRMSPRLTAKLRSLMIERDAQHRYADTNFHVLERV